MAILGSQIFTVDGGSYTAEAGSDRLVVFAIVDDVVTDTNAISAVTFGGVSADILVQNNLKSEISAIAVIPEASIPSGSNPIVVTTTEASQTSLRIAPYTLSGRKQTAPYGSTNVGGHEQFTGTVNPWIGDISVASGADAVVSVTGVVPSREASTVTGDFVLDYGGSTGDIAHAALSGQNLTSGTAAFELTWSSAQNGAWTAASFDPVGAPAARKGSTFTVDKPGTLGTVTTATLNSVNVFDHLTAQDTTTATFAGAFTDEITTSGEYTLVLGDGTTTENITVQVNVVGLASFNINKDGTDQASLTDVEFLILTGAEGSRAINNQIVNVTTTAGGDTGPIEITDTALNAGDTIMVAQQSATVGGGVYHPATLELI